MVVSIREIHRHSDNSSGQHSDVCCLFAAENSFLRRFLADSASMDPEQRAHLLENPPEGYPDIDEAHEVINLPELQFDTN